jgi:hypothetical protein
MLNKWYPPLSSELRSRIVTLWAVLLVAALVVGAIAVYMGGFIRGNVRDQLAAQQIQFTAAAELTPVEQAEAACLTQYGGTTMTTGDQARCYSEHYIGLHMQESATKAGFPGATYATLGKEQTQLRAQIVAAAGNPDAVKALTDKLTAAGSLRTTLQSGSTLRGQLLNAWGWDTFGIGILVTGVALLAVALVFGSALAYELRTTAVADETVAGRAGGLAAAAR